MSENVEGRTGNPMRDWVDDHMHHETDPQLPQQVAEGEGFIQAVARPAFEEAARTLTRDGNEVNVRGDGTNLILQAVRDGQEVFSYAVRTQLTDNGSFPVFEARGPNGRLNGENQGHLRPDTPENRGHNVTHITQDELVRHILNAYKVEMDDNR